MGSGFPDPHALADAVAERVAAVASAPTEAEPYRSARALRARELRRASPESEGAPTAILEAAARGPLCDVIAHSWGSQALSFLQARFPEVRITFGDELRSAAAESRALPLLQLKLECFDVHKRETGGCVSLTPVVSTSPTRQMCRRRVYMEPVCFLPGFGHWMRCAGARFAWLSSLPAAHISCCSAAAKGKVP